MPDGTHTIGRTAKKRQPGRRPLGSRRLRWSVLCDIPAFMVPQSIHDVRELARMIALAEWAPQSHRDIQGNYVLQKIELAIMHGVTVGLGPIAAVQSIALINGMPTIWGDGALSLVERSGLLEDMIEQYELDEEQGLTAICTMKRRHRPTPITNRFSIAMADHARLTQKEGPWQTYPQRMLRMRARSWTIRDGFADVLRGLHIREEVDDFIEIRGMRQPPTTALEDRPINGLRARGSPRPKRLIESTSGKPPASEDVPTKPLPTPAANGAQPIPEGTQEGETVTLVDADGAFIDVAGQSALQERFEEVFFNKRLSVDQIVGVWESNEVAREAIARLLGPEALASAAERFQSAQSTRNLECGEGPPRGGASSVWHLLIKILPLGPGEHPVLRVQR